MSSTKQAGSGFYRSLFRLLGLLHIAGAGIFAHAAPNQGLRV